MDQPKGATSASKPGPRTRRVVGAKTGQAAANGNNRLELFLRYQTAAKRDFFRALEEFEKRKKVTTKT